MIARGVRGSGPGGINPLLLIALLLLVYGWATGGLVAPIQRAAQDPIAFVGFVVAIVLGITVHEFMHAYTATRLGDDTARLLGRLSLNPMAHLDPFGTLLIVLAGFGYGKPVPFNESRLRSALGVSAVRWDRFLRLNFVAAGLWAVAFVGAGYFLGHAFRAVLGDLARTFSLVMLGVFVESGFTPAALAYLAEIAEERPEDRGSVMGVYSVLLSVGQLIGGALAAPFAARLGINGLILLTGLLCLVALFTVMLLGHSERRLNRALSPA